jgi:3-methyladenine DNA glycosylase Mpg
MAIKNMNDIRAILCDEIEKLRDNKTTAANVNAVTNATGKILSTIKLEMEYAKLTNKNPVSTFVQLEDKPKMQADKK